MSLYNYFSKFGTVNYNGEIVNNIISSVRFKDAIKSKVTIFYPYTISEGERPDNIAFNYYEDERYSWVVYLSNSIVDPYYQWPLSLKEFNAFIIKKYGTIEKAINKIAFFRNAWYRDDSMLSISAYNSLSTNRKKYWKPIVGFSGQVGSYERRSNDLVVETNLIRDVLVSDSEGFTIGERVFQSSSGTVTSVGEIKAIRGDHLLVNNFTSLQYFATTAGSIGSIVGEDSKTSRSVVSATTVNTPIPTDELIYWEPVSTYDYENEVNESRKNIKLIDRQYLPILEDQILELLT